MIANSISGWFGLSRASWLTLPRVLMMDMPKDWQQKMADLLEEYDETFPNPPEIGTTVRATNLNGKLIGMPKWLNNYRYPDREQLHKARGNQ